MGDDTIANASIYYKDAGGVVHEVPAETVTFGFDEIEVTAKTADRRLKDGDSEICALHADGLVFYDHETIEETAEIATGCIGLLLKGFMDEHAFHVDPVKKVVFNDPATVVYWIDGSKTVVKRSEDDRWDPEKGLLLCFMKRMFGNTGRFNDVLKEWMREGE